MVDYSISSLRTFYICRDRRFVTIPANIKIILFQSRNFIKLNRSKFLRITLLFFFTCYLEIYSILVYPCPISLCKHEQFAPVLRRLRLNILSCLQIKYLTQFSMQALFEWRNPFTCDITCQNACTFTANGSKTMSSNGINYRLVAHNGD